MQWIFVELLSTELRLPQYLRSVRRHVFLKSEHRTKVLKYFLISNYSIQLIICSDAIFISKAHSVASTDNERDDVSGNCILQKDTYMKNRIRILSETATIFEVLLHQAWNQYYYYFHALQRSFVITFVVRPPFKISIWFLSRDRDR